MYKKREKKEQEVKEKIVKKWEKKYLDVQISFRRIT